MENYQPSLTLKWVRISIFAGLIACIVYPILILVELPRMLQVTLGASFGPALMVASIGLFHLLRIHKDTIGIQIATISNILAGTVVTAMIISQLALKAGAENYFEMPSAKDFMHQTVTRIWDVILGLDVTFDVFIGLGTALFGFAMISHPRFGKIIGIAGMVIGIVILLGFNFYTFPTPPRDAGLFDPGPVSGLWYLWVVIMTIRSLRWVKEQAK